MTVTQKRYSIPGVTGNSYEFASPATAVPVIGVLQPFAYAVQLPLVKLQLEPEDVPAVIKFIKPIFDTFAGAMYFVQKV